MEEAESCQSLPFTLLLVFSYAMMVIAHDDAQVVNAVEDSIVLDIGNNANFAWSSPFMGHKDVEDVNSHPDFWSWMSRGFVGLIFQQEWGWAEGRDTSDPLFVQAKDVFERKDRGMLLHYNKIIGGVRLRQERSDEEGDEVCPSLNSLLVFWGKEC